jgi:hypothetical protein
MARFCRAPGKALPFIGKEGKKASPPFAGREAYKRRHLPSWEKDAYKRRLGTCPERQDLQARGERIPRGDLLSSPREHAWRTRGGSPLRRTYIRHHYHDRCGNDGQDRLVESHCCSALDGVKDSSVPTPVGLCHCPKSRDICHTCNLATVVSP